MSQHTQNLSLSSSSLNAITQLKHYPSSSTSIWENNVSSLAMSIRLGERSTAFCFTFLTAFFESFLFLSWALFSFSSFFFFFPLVSSLPYVPFLAFSLLLFSSLPLLLEPVFHVLKYTQICHFFSLVVDRFSLFGFRWHSLREY